MAASAEIDVTSARGVDSVCASMIFSTREKISAHHNVFLNEEETNRMLRTSNLTAVIALAALSLAGCATAEPEPQVTPETQVTEDAVEFPAGDIRFIVPFPAGSAPDSNARVVAQELEADLGVSVIVENIEGGASTIGLLELVNSDPDGTTIAIAGSSVSVQSRLVDSAFGGVDSLTSIAQLSAVPNLVYASPSKGWESIDDFIEAAKENPGLTVGLGRAGAVQHIQIELLEESAGINLEPVYFGAGQMVLPAVTGTVDISVSQPGPVTQYVETGELILLGALGNVVPAGLDVALIDDSGYTTSDFSAWEGIFGPADMPAEIVEALAAAIERAVASDAYSSYAEGVFGVPLFAGPEDFSQIVSSTDKLAIELIEKLGL